MMRLKSKLLSLNATKTEKVKIYSPRNCEELRIPFKTDKTAKVVGKLASITPPTRLPTDDDYHLHPQLVTGVLVQNDFKLSLMAPEDLREYAGLTTTTIVCRQKIMLAAAGVDLIRWALESTFGAVDELPEMRQLHKEVPNGDDMILDAKEEEVVDEEVERPVAGYIVMGSINVRCFGSGEVELEWEGNTMNDGFADAVMAVLLTVESSPAAVKSKFNLDNHPMHI